MPWCQNCRKRECSTEGAPCSNCQRSLDRDAEERLKSVEEQITECERTAVYKLKCPYCGVDNCAEAEELCCNMLAKAVGAVIHRKEFEDKVRKLDNLMEFASRN